MKGDTSYTKNDEIYFKLFYEPNLYVFSNIMF